VKVKLGTAIVILRWIARVWSIASIGLFLLFFIGEGFAPAKVAPKEWVGLGFFPIGVVVGMLVAWRKESWGGGITVTSLLAFYGVYGYLFSGAFPRGWTWSFSVRPAYCSWWSRCSHSTTSKRWPA
jgi:hypothetical protein